MNYPCLKCVIEYMEANQRFRLSSKCPAIRKFERSIPLHLERLSFSSTTFRINDHCYKAKWKVMKHKESALPEDFVLDNLGGRLEFSNNYQVVCSSQEIYDDDLDEDINIEILKIFPDGVHFHETMEWLGYYLFGRRREITTKKLVVNVIKVLRLPENFKIKTGILETMMENLDAIFEFIHPVVEEIIFPPYIENPLKNHPMIQLAKKICFKSGRWTVRRLSFVHKNIEHQGHLPELFFEMLLRNWTADGREIGSTFSFNSKNEWAELRSLQYFEKVFNGRKIYKKLDNTWDGTPEDLAALLEEFMKLHGLDEKMNILYCTCLPMNSTSELQISLSNGHQGAFRAKIVLKVVPLELPR